MTTTSKPAWVREQLEVREAKAAKAAVKAKQALSEIGKASANGHALLEKLCTYERSIRTRRPGVTNSDETRRKLTADLVAAVVKGEFLAAPIDDGACAAGVRFVDPRPSALYEELRIEAANLKAEARAFAQEHAETLREAEQAAVMERYRRAVKGNDPYELAAAQKALPTLPDVNTLTTQDL